MALLLAKGEDFASWRGVEDFAVAYREASVRLVSRQHPEGIAQLLEVIADQISDVERKNSQLWAEVEELNTGLSDAEEQSQLRGLLEAVYGRAYQHFSRFRSPVAFFNTIDQFLHNLSGHFLHLVKQEISINLPPVALVVMGPAGRREATRFCRIQMALVWDGDASEELMDQLGQGLVTWFRVCGIALEESITPLNPDWRGSLEQWEDRFEMAAKHNDQRMLIELLRLTDRTALINEGGVADRFGTLCRQYLSKREFVGNLVERCALLSNGIGLMGSLRLEKSGPHRGEFSLQDYALLPLAAAVAASCLIHGVDLVGTPGRLRNLVRINKFDVDLAERALHAWHCFSEHRLSREQKAVPGQDCRDILHLAPATLGTAEFDRLRLSLETVADLQRYLQVSFGSYT